MYNIQKLIDEYIKRDIGKKDLTIEDIKQLFDIAKKPQNIRLNDVLYDGIISAWRSGYIAGYHKAQKDKKKMERLTNTK